jgi:hypothetical protein
MKDLCHCKDLFSAEVLKDKGHLSKIIALQPFSGTEAESATPGNTELSPTQVKLTYIHQIVIICKTPPNSSNIHL